MRIPDFDYLVASLAYTNEKRIRRTYSYNPGNCQTYICPTCKRSFDCYDTSTNAKSRRQYSRLSPQAKRHYERPCCIPRFTLIKEGYLRNDPKEIRKGYFHKAKPLLSDSVQYILGLGKFNLSFIQLLISLLTTGKIKLQPSPFDVNINIKPYKKVDMGSLLGNDKSSILLNSIEVISSDPELMKNIENIITKPVFDNIEEIQNFVSQRLQVMTRYIRTKNQMRHMPSFRGSELKRSPQKITDGMMKYLEEIDSRSIMIPTPHIGLLSGYRSIVINTIKLCFDSCHESSSTPPFFLRNS